MKKIYCLFILLFLSFGMPAYAQSINMQVSLGTQALFNHQIPVDFSMTPDISLDKATVNWILPDSLKTIKDESTSYTTPLLSGQTMYDHLIVVPQFAGTYQISTNVSGIYQGEEFSTTKTITFVVDQNLHVSDNTNNFSARQSIYIALSLVFLLLFFILLKDVYTNLRQQFLIWLNKEG